MVAREIRSGVTLRLFGNELKGLETPPFPVDDRALHVAYYASAEWGCYLALGWPLPARILDLYAEFRCKTAGLTVPNGFGLLGALAYHGLDAIGAIEKEAMRALAMRGGPYSPDERLDLLDYCQEDVDALARLLPAMITGIDLPRALLRGRYTAAARIEREGVPIDVETLARLREHWEEVKDRLIIEVDRNYGVFDGRSFRAERWAAWLGRQGIPWPLLESGALDLKDDTFREMARAHLEIALMRELGMRCHRCGWLTWLSALTAVTDVCCRRSLHGPQETSPRIAGSFLGPRRGYAA
jgi:DNA polymerase I